MALLTWNGSLLTGVDAVDLQHRRLVEILNQLHEAMLMGGKAHDVASVMSELVTYTRYHFSSEERLMREANYPGLAEHVKKHQAMVAKVEQFSREVAEGKATVTMRLMSFLKDWLAKHILETDRQFGDYVKRQAA